MDIHGSTSCGQRRRSIKRKSEDNMDDTLMRERIAAETLFLCSTYTSTMKTLEDNYTDACQKTKDKYKYDKANRKEKRQEALKRAEEKYTDTCEKIKSKYSSEKHKQKDKKKAELNKARSEYLDEMDKLEQKNRVDISKALNVR